MLQRLGQLRHDEKGATAIEYGLIVSLVVLAIIGAVTAVADSTIDMWTYVTTEVTAGR